MKNIRRPLITVSLVCGVLFGFIVGLISDNALYGLIALGIVTSVILFTLCLVSMND